MVSRRSIGRIACCLASVLLCEAAFGQVVYVDDSATGAGDGSSWCDGYVALQDALAVASFSGGSITEIRVAQGTYKPDVGAGQSALARASTFQLINGVSLLGGYAGCGAPNPNAQGPTAYPTILTGDLAGNDVGDRFNIVSRGENAYHVVTGSGTNATAILDGFLVVAGFADGAGSTRDGGGLYNDGGSPTVRNCTFSGNSADGHGGAIRNWRSSSPTITDCLIIDNGADWGAGINNVTQSNPIIADCTISNNTAGSNGAGVYNDYSSAPQISRCIISDNASFFSGAGMANFNQSSPLVTNCRFERNTIGKAGAGGGVYSQSSDPTFVGCIFDGNIAAIIGGGGAYNAQGAPTFDRCIFRENHAKLGGGLLNDDSKPFINNCLFVRNTARINGAAIYNFSLLGAGDVIITNTTFTRNEAEKRGGGIYNSSDNPTITNSILWDNSDEDGSGETAQLRGGVPIINYSGVSGWTGTLGGVGNHGLDPRFTSGPEGCFYLSQKASGSSVQSPAVDTGDTDATSVALDGLTTRRDRITDTGIVDMGFHYAVTDKECAIGNYTCHGRINLRDLAHFQRCFDSGGQPTGASCCEQFDVDGKPGVTLTDFALLAPAVSNP